MTTHEETLRAITSFGGDPSDLPFWCACAMGKFLLHRCGLCERHYWPASRCIEHGDTDMAWTEARGVGELYTYTVQHHAYTAAMQRKVPYVIGVVKLAEGPFFHSRIIDCSMDAIHVGMPLAVEFVFQEGLALPLFRRSG